MIRPHLVLALLLFAPQALALQSPPDERVARAEKFLKTRDFQSANAIFLVLAEGGNPHGMYHLGRAYGRGWGVGKDAGAGLDWLKQAYRFKFDKRGMAAYEVGRLYQTQPDVRDYKAAIAWFRRSLEEGYPKGHVQLAVLMDRGLGDKRNPKGALYHLQRAAKHGYPQSQIAYARKLKDGAYGPAEDREIALWAERAVKTLKRQTRNGSATAATRLGKLYMTGDIVPFDAARAKKWLKRGGKLGNRWAPEYLRKLESQSK